MKTSLLSFGLLIFSITNAQNVFREDFASYAAPLQFSGTGNWSNSASSGFPESGGCAGIGCVLSQILASPVIYTGYGSSENYA
ncbi:MAG: hypothetical protein H7174_04910 [Flavobacterium sp.]|nr:hypothetical protein [Flavobacterium sp.]